MYLNLQILQVALLDYFLTSTFMNPTFQFPEYMKQSLEKKCSHINNNMYVKFLEQCMFFSFHVVWCSLPYIWNLIIDSWNIWWTCLPASSYSPLFMIKVEKTPNRNVENSEKPPWLSIWNVFILWNSKKYVFTCLHENKSFFNSVKQNNPTYFAKIAEPRFNYAFLLFDSVEVVTQESTSVWVSF